MEEDPTERISRAFVAGGVHQHAARGDTLRTDAPDTSMRLPLLRLGGPDDASADLVLGATLGEGGMGIISLARQNVLRRDVAVKRLRSPQTDSGALLHEALVMGLVEHPNVVPVHLVGRDLDGGPVIIMKRVEGVTWGDILSDPLAAPATDLVDLDYHLRVLLQLCNAVRFAHARGVLHLDIKPDNVLIGEFGEVYLADWGIATRFDEARAASPQTPVGTATHMAPEMAAGSAFDERTDVFLLGATLFQVLNGHPVYDGNTAMECVMLAFRCSPPTFSNARDVELNAIAAKALAKEPADRFATVSDFRQALLDYLVHREAISLAKIADRGVADVIQVIDRGGRPDPAVLAETRFALRRSFEIWPQSPDAALLRDALGRAVFHWALKRGEFEEASRALLEIAPADVAPLEQSLEAARRQNASEQEEIRSLKLLADRDTGRRARVTLGVLLAVFWSGVAGYKAWSRWGVPLEEVKPNYLLSLLPTIGLPVLVTIAFWRQFNSTDFNRRVLSFMMGGFASIVLIRLAGWKLGLAAYVTTAMEFITYTLLAFLFSTLSDSRMTAAAVPLLLATILAVAFPGYQYAFMLAAFLLFAPYVARLLATSDIGS